MEKCFDTEWVGDDGEVAPGMLYYKIEDGKVDPESLRGIVYDESNAARVSDDVIRYMLREDTWYKEEYLALAVEHNDPS